MLDMISFSTLTNAAQASSYHDEHLSRGDYYDDKERASSSWFGSGSESLGLSGKCTKDDFEKLCNNRRPDGEKLTSRDDAERRVAFDFTIAPPKSVSIAALVGGDERVRDAHRAAVAAAKKELESFAAVRVRTGTDNGKDTITGNVIGASFEHETSRAAGNGITPDPQLHTHLVVFNATKDGNGDFKALQNFEMLRARSLVNAVYEHRLCQELKAAGYETREMAKGWELSNISDAEIWQFSKRHNAIQKAVNEEIEKNGVGNRKALAAEVAQDNRIRKQPTATAAALRADWQAQRAALGVIEAVALDNEKAAPEITSSDAVAHAKGKLFERSAVVRDVDVLTETFKRARGSGATVEELKAAVRTDDEILKSADGRQVTTAAVLKNEARVVGIVKDGKEKFAPLAAGGLVGERAEKLTDRQREAAKILVESKDAVTVFRGGAGTGKSFTLGAVKDSVEAAGGKILAIAPQNKQVLGLKSDGFADAQTLSSFLNAKEPPGRGTVLLVDEAGQIAGADMRRLLEKAHENGCRVILSGDTRQHGAVAASDALIVIERHAQARTAELAADSRTIQRQKVAWYKEAVSLADKGLTGVSFDILEKNGVLRENPDALKSAAASAVAAGQDGQSVLVVSQTNASVNRLNYEIRQELKAAGRIGPEVEILGLRGVDSTKAEMGTAARYQSGEKLVAHSKGDKWERGEMLSFVREGRAGGNAIVARNEQGKEFAISGRNLEKFQLAREERISVGVGDKIQLRSNITFGKEVSKTLRNGERVKTFKTDGRKLANGQIVEVARIGKNGELTVKAGGKEIQLPKDFRQFSHGYAVTSYGSQGATVDKVIIADSGSQGAANRKEYYVSISRGKNGIEIHTPDKAGLRERIGATGERGLALDVVKPSQPARQPGQRKEFTRPATRPADLRGPEKPIKSASAVKPARTSKLPLPVKPVKAAKMPLPVAKTTRAKTKANQVKQPAMQKTTVKTKMASVVRSTTRKVGAKARQTTKTAGRSIKSACKSTLDFLSGRTTAQKNASRDNQAGHERQQTTNRSRSNTNER